MVKKVLLSIVAVLSISAIAIVAIAATKPDHFSFERKAIVKAPPERVYPLISNFHEWQRWSPWEKLDPKMKRDYSGPDAGVGAVYAWDGNGDAGQGKMTITQAAAPNQVKLNLDFIKPFEACNQVTFDIAPLNEKETQITWKMEGESQLFPCKVVSVFCSMNDMCGKDFDAGLASIKAISEKQEVAAQQQDVEPKQQ